MSRETLIESKLRRGCKSRRWRCDKLYGNGLPDRLIITTYGIVCFVETKCLGGIVSVQQEVIHEDLRGRGQTVYIPYTKEDVDDIFKELDTLNREERQLFIDLSLKGADI